MPARRVPPSAATPAEHSFRRALGAAIRARRAELLLSQEMLGERADLHQTYVSDVENGKRNLALGALLRLAFGLEMTLSDLCARAERLVAGSPAPEQGF